MKWVTLVLVCTKTLGMFINAIFQLLQFWLLINLSLSNLICLPSSLVYFQRLHKCLQTHGFNVIDIVSADVGKLCKVIHSIWQ